MMRIKTIIAILFVSVTLSQGCGVTASVSATDVTQPVMLGKKIRIYGTANERWQLRAPFDISIANSQSIWIGTHRSAGSKANRVLLRLIETSDDKIVIDEVYIGSYCVLFVGPYTIAAEEEKSWADIKGGIYHEKADAHEPK